jgi:two-component system NtrC family sensor kinase
MPEIDANPPRPVLWRRLHQSLSAKLIVLLLGALVAIFALLIYLNLTLQRKHLEAAALGSAERVSDVIKSSTSYSMLRNDRDGLYQMMATIGREPGMVRVRIFDETGRISYSTEDSEVNHSVDKGAEACYGCHAQSQALTRLKRPDRFRIYRAASGERVLGIITPIENKAECSNAACHAHPESKLILGVLDTNISLAKADAQLAEGRRRLVAYTLFAMLSIAGLSWVFVWKVVHEPIKTLKAGTHRLAAGDLGHQIDVHANDELGELAHDFNVMSRELESANEQVLQWTKTLEDRVEKKTSELKRAHDHVLHVEKMASIGKMAAVVAHEINNPLAGILTYSKLLRKWLDRGDIIDRKEESAQCLDLIASESKRCGELVKNLLTFSRTSPLNLQPTVIDDVIERSLLLIQHKLEMNGVQVQTTLADLPPIMADAAQIEQVLLVLIVNAADAMPKGGNLWITTSALPDGHEAHIQIRDDGCGIAPDVLSQIFEPFLTTKDTGQGVGLGLAISRTIVERHRGRIEVQSEQGRGSTFTVVLPLAEPGSPAKTNELVSTQTR